MHPMLIRDTQEISPGICQVMSIIQQLVPVQIVRKEPLAEGDGLVCTHLIKPGLLPDLIRRFDDKRTGVLIESICVCLKPAPCGLLKGEGECLKELVCS